MIHDGQLRLTMVDSGWFTVDSTWSPLHSAHAEVGLDEETGGPVLGIYMCMAIMVMVDGCLSMV